jgi:site-specific DNA-methyltransferase (adenine-specific)
LRKEKGNGHLNAKKMPMRDKEDMLVFYREQPIYNPQFGYGTPYKSKAGKDHGARTSMAGSYGAYTNKREDRDGRRNPKQVWSSRWKGAEGFTPPKSPLPYSST